MKHQASVAGEESAVVFLLQNDCPDIKLKLSEGVPFAGLKLVNPFCRKDKTVCIPFVFHNIHKKK